MVNIKWCETADASSCITHDEWNLMTEYIKHSAVTDFTIYGTENECVDTDQIFRFTSTDNYAQIYGMSAAGKDLMISANDGEFRSRITLLGGGSIHLDSGDDIFFKENGIEKFKFYDGKSIDFNGDRAIHIDDDETYVGHGAGDGITTGVSNTLIGHDAGNAITSLDYNVIIGCEAQKVNNVANCVLIGYHAGESNTRDNVVAIGYNSLFVNTGDANCALGYKTLEANTSGFDNMAIGAYTLYHNTSGQRNTGLGKTALGANTTGSYNTALGYRAADSAAIGINSCIYLGHEAGKNNAASNRLYINPNNSAFPLIYGEFDNDVVKFGNSSDAFFFKFSYTGNDAIVETEVANRSIFLKPHGTGFVKFGAYVATPAADSTGYIIIEDAAGNQRKLMVQA